MTDETKAPLPELMDSMRPTPEAVRVAELVMLADKSSFPPAYGSHLAIPLLAATVLRINEAFKGTAPVSATQERKT